MSIALDLLIGVGMTPGEAIRHLEGRTLTPEQFAERMKWIIDSERDKDAKHQEMDRLLIIALRELGYGAGCDLYNAQRYT